MFSPVYSVTAKLLASVSLIERARGRIDAARLTAEQAADLQEQAELEMVVASAGLSDHSLDRGQIEAILAGREVHARARAVTEVRNAKAGIEWARERQLDTSPLTLDDIRQLHRVFTKDLAAEHESGVFRAGPAVIVHQYLGAVWGDYEAPPADVIEPRMSALLRWLAGVGSDLHPVVAAGIAHQEITSIRPFMLGTGQIGRLVSRIALGQHGYSFHNGLALGSYYLANRTAYHAALDNGATYLERARASCDQWLDFYLRGLLNEVDRLTATIAAFKVEGFAPAAGTLRRDEASLLAFAHEYGSLTKHDAASILSPLPGRLVAKRLAAMVEAGELVEDASAGQVRYRLPPGLNAPAKAHSQPFPPAPDLGRK
ncbi:MAG: Fic family protein [Bifidobacteriaceae bacterium]|jgi:Fic family protein|nr:Fic family protein [Bifidobacteriaceae bacterium]